MSNFKETFKKWWWVGLIILFVIGEMALSSNGKGNSKSRSSNNSEAYYKWPCKYCGKRLHMDEVLSLNQGPYTPENGFVFCSQDCWHAFQNLGH